MTDCVKNLFSVDVEDWYQVTNYATSIPPDTWERYDSRLLDSTLRLLDLMGRHGIKGTFFVLGWNAERFPDVVRAIQRDGHEIGTHGYDHRLVYDLTPKAYLASLRRSIQILEDLTGQPITAHRASDFSVTRDCLWAFEVLCDLGIKYDSSVFPIRRRRYGIADAPRFPHRVTLADGRSLIEVPLSTFRVLGQNLPIAGGGYLRLLPYGVTRRAIADLNRRGRPAVLYMHPWEIDPGQPIPDGAPFMNVLAHRLNISRTYEKLDCLARDFHFAEMSRVIGEDLPDASRTTPDRHS